MKLQISMQTEIRRKYSWYKGGENYLLGQTEREELYLELWLCAHCTLGRSKIGHIHTL